MEDLLHLAPFLAPQEKIILLDPGGNVYHWAAYFLSFFPCTDIVAFEPDPRAQARHASRLQARPNVTFHQVAASSAPGHTAFHIADDTVYSSLEAYSETQADREIMIGKDWKIDLATLNSLGIATFGYDATVLNIDVQGHEIDAILGATKTLKTVGVVIGDFSFASQYEGVEPSFSHVCGPLHDAGLYPAIIPCYGRQFGSPPSSAALCLRGATELINSSAGISFALRFAGACSPKAT